METLQRHHEYLTSGPAAAQHEQQILKLGGMLALLGGLGYFITLLLHGDLPDQTTEIALTHIAGRPEWATLKLSLIVSIMLSVGGFTALASSLSHGASWLLARMAAAVLLIGAAVVVVEYSILGYEAKRIADAWHTATGADREHYQLIAEALFGISGGLFVSFIAWLFGLPYLLMGLAIASGRAYPAAMGWVAAVGGGGALLGGTMAFLRIELVPIPALYGAFIVPLNLWLATMGMFMWRRSRSVIDRAATAAALQTARG
jgi:hypothetical protein